jgi:hypothetical protein
MTIKSEKWDQKRPDDIKVGGRMAKSFILSAASIYLIVLVPCIFMDWFFAWTWTDAHGTTELDSSAPKLAFAVITHAVQTAFLVIVGLWYVTLPIIWLNALAISKRIRKQSTEIGKPISAAQSCEAE